jgi:hypothetical protein
MTTVLAVAIGLILMYLILALIVSAVNEGLASLTDRRAIFLRKGVKNLLGEGMTKEFYEHGLIRGLTRKDARGNRNPSYVSSSTFATVVGDLVSGKPQPAAEQPDRRPSVDMPGLAQRLASDDDDGAGDLQDALRTFVNEAVDWEDLKSRIESWFNEAMERVSGWYRRRTRVVLWLLALGLVAALNADTVHVARVLWLDPTVRTAAAVAARESVQEDAAAADDAADQPLEAAAEAADAIGELQGVGLPLRWSEETTPDDGGGWALKVLGLLITAFALTFGAPFWFDVLKRFVGVRSSGPPPEEEKKP